MLTPSQRKKVAEAVLPKHEWFVMDDGVLAKMAWGSFQVFDPRHYPLQKDALVSKIAGLIEAEIEERPAARRADCWTKAHEHLLRFNKALSTNSTHDLESLAYELLEAE